MFLLRIYQKKILKKKIMNESGNDFYTNWLTKAELIDTNSLEGVFDKYVSLFIAYNFLYNEIPIKLIKTGIHVSPSLTDSKKATELPIKLLGAERIMNNWRNCADEIELIKDLIRNETFYINLKHGERQRNEDLKILSFLNSKKIDQQVKGILQVIYFVRCNLVHGHKNFVQYQEILLTPLIKLLRKLMDILKEGLE